MAGVVLEQVPRKRSHTYASWNSDPVGVEDIAGTGSLRGGQKPGVGLGFVSWGEGFDPAGAGAGGLGFSAGGMGSAICRRHPWHKAGAC